MIARAPIPIHRAGIVSSLGIGFDTFANAMRDARTADASAVTKVHDPAMPARGARTVSYDAAQLLGVKGLAALNRMSQMAILACEEALPDRSNTATDVGVVLGTSGGSLRSITDFVRSTYAGTQPHMISPLQFPNTVMNCAAAQCAIRFGLTGVNSTVCGGELSSLVALLYAVRALRAGHCGTIIAGGIEEYCDFTAWSHEASIDADDAPIGEGAALFSLGGSDEGAIAQILGVSQRRVGSGLVADRRRRDDVARLLAEAGLVDADIVWRMDGRAMSPADAAMRFGIEHDVVDLSGRSRQALGDTNSASFGFQFATALAIAPDGVGMLTADGREHQFGCALVRILPRTVN